MMIAKINRNISPEKLVFFCLLRLLFVISFLPLRTKIHC